MEGTSLPGIQSIGYCEKTVLSIAIGKDEIILYFRYVVVFCGLARKPNYYYFCGKKFI